MESKECKKISIFYAFIILVYTFSEGLFGYGFTAFMYNRGLSIAYIGILMGLTDLFITIFDFPSGNLADKYGRKKICGIGFIIYGIGFFIFGSSKVVWIFLISGIVRALGIALISGAPASWYLNELSKRSAFQYKDKVLPFIRGLSLLIGSLSGILAGNIAKINISYPIYVGGALLSISGIIILMLFDDNIGSEIKQNSIVATIIKNSSNFLKDGNMKALARFGIFKTVMFTIFILSWQIYATEVVGLSTTTLGYLYTVMLLLMSFSSFFTKYLLKSLQGITITIAGACISIIGVTFFFMNTLILFILGFVLFEFGMGLLNSSYYTWLYDYIPENVMSSYTSALSSIESLVAFILSMFMGSFIQRIGFNFGWSIAIIFEILAVYSLIQMKKGLKVVDNAY